MLAARDDANRADKIKRVIFGIVMIGGNLALEQVVGLASPWFAITASFCILGLFWLLAPFVPYHLPRPLRPVRAWETHSRLYRVLGVLAFGKMLRRSPLRLLNRDVYLASVQGDLGAAQTQVERSEAAHFWGGLLTIPYLIAAWRSGWWSVVSGLLVFNVVVNVYPILHLRSVRARLERTMRKGKK